MGERIWPTNSSDFMLIYARRATSSDDFTTRGSSLLGHRWRTFERLTFGGSVLVGPIGVD